MSSEQALKQFKKGRIPIKWTGTIKKDACYRDTVEIYDLKCIKSSQGVINNLNI